MTTTQIINDLDFTSAPINVEKILAGNKGA